MKGILNISLIQADLHWEDPGANLEMLEAMLEKVPGDTDLVLLPETFSTGFSMRAGELAEKKQGQAQRWMEDMARKHEIVLTGSLIYRSEEGQVFNRLFWMSPKGSEGYYNKRHLFRPGGESEQFSPGTERRLFELKGFRILPLICYDLRFPVFSRNRDDYDVLVYVANWPAARQTVWEVLTRARAIENQAWVLACNRTGTDGKGVRSTGGSCVIDPKGEIVQKLGEEEGLLTAKLDLEQLRQFREKFPAWKDRDPFRIKF